MPGIASVLNIAKEALLTHQASVGVASHNVANVDTPGYTRQVLQLTTSIATPEGNGFFGNGVRGLGIERQYDKFMVQRLMEQNSTLKHLEAQQESMRIVETIFNEAPGMALSDLMGQFWESMQILSNDPELSASRQTVVQQADLLNEQFNLMAQEMTQARYDLGVQMATALDNVNALTTELADLNSKIVGSESDMNKMNDLRDSRDELLKDLAGYVEVNYFELDTGAYTVMTTKGHTLVEDNQNWDLDYSDDSLYWLNTDPHGHIKRTAIADSHELGGNIGGMISIMDQLEENNPDNFRGRLDVLANALIREVNQQHSQGVGLTRFSDDLTSADLARNTILLHAAVNPDTAAETISAGTITINNREVGMIVGGVTTYGLAMTKAYNAANAINEAYSGAAARLTTQVSGDPVTAVIAANDDMYIDFTVNDVPISYQVNAAGAPDDTDPAIFAASLAAQINTDIGTYNSAQNPITLDEINIPKVYIRAEVGNGMNGAATNAIILKNTSLGDESAIIIDFDTTASPLAANLGLTAGTFNADATHNTGELSVFDNDGPLEIEAGNTDDTLDHFGWASEIYYSDSAAAPPALDTTETFDLNGSLISVNMFAAESSTQTAQRIVSAINAESINTGVTATVGNGTNGGPIDSVVFRSNVGDIMVSTATDSASFGFGSSNFTKENIGASDEKAGDGKLTYEFDDNGVEASIMGFQYSDHLIRDDSGFNIWIYDNDGTLALPQPVFVPLERAYTLGDVRNAINISVVNAIDDDTISTNAGNSWLTASVVDNRLVITPDADHQFAFGGDTSNFLATAGINTLLTGNSASDIGLNEMVENDHNNIAAGTINSFGEMFYGDNSNVLEITNIQRDEYILFEGGLIDTLDGHYNSLVAEVGMLGRAIDDGLEYNSLVLNQLNQLRDSTSGVSLDEEMANLIKYQHAYSAAAKLITTSDEMLQSLLSAV